MRLCKLISTHNTREINTDLKEMDDIKIDEEDTGLDELELSMNFYMQIKKSIVIQTGDKDNMLFLPSLVPLLDKKIKQLPLWGAVMSVKFKSESINCSSSNCEASFRYVFNYSSNKIEDFIIYLNFYRYIKRDLFSNSRKMRTDIFLYKSIDDSMGSLKIATARYNRSRKTFFLKT